jgi:hypothetical protein
MYFRFVLTISIISILIVTMANNPIFSLVEAQEQGSHQSINGDNKQKVGAGNPGVGADQPAGGALGQSRDFFAKAFKQLKDLMVHQISSTATGGIFGAIGKFTGTGGITTITPTNQGGGQNSTITPTNQGGGQNSTATHHSKSHGVQQLLR